MGVSYVDLVSNNGTGASFGLTPHASSQVGDLLLVGLLTFQVITPPAGWTTLNQWTDANIGFRHGVFVKPAQSGDLGVAHTFGLAGSHNWFAHTLTLRGAARSGWPAPVQRIVASTSPTVFMPAQTVPKNDSMIVGFAINSAGTFTATAPSGWTKRAESAGADFAVMTRPVVTAGAVAEETGSWSGGTGGVHSHSTVISPFSGGLKMVV